MKIMLSRILATAALAVIAWLLLAGASPSRTRILEPDKLIILSTTDVKAKTGPCG